MGETSSTIGVTIDDYEALQALDSSITNLSSIMFLVESAGKKILFTGDGLGSDIVESLSEKRTIGFTKVNYTLIS